MGIFVDNDLGGYFTCLEMDAETLYIQYGGAMPHFMKTRHVMFGYSKMINWVVERYKYCWTRIEAENEPMLKMAYKMGFKINGNWFHNNKIYLELINNFGG